VAHAEAAAEAAEEADAAEAEKAEEAAQVGEEKGVEEEVVEKAEKTDSKQEATMKDGTSTNTGTGTSRNSMSHEKFNPFAHTEEPKLGSGASGGGGEDGSGRNAAAEMRLLRSWLLSCRAQMSQAQVRGGAHSAVLRADQRMSRRPRATCAVCGGKSACSCARTLAGLHRTERMQ